MRLHLVYFHPDKYNGYGACYEDRFIQRVKTQELDVDKLKIISRGLTAEEASDRERILQVRDGFPLDDKPYIEILRLGAIGRANMTQETHNKRKASIDYSVSIKGLQRVWESKMKKVRVTDYKTGRVIGTYTGIAKIARELGVDSSNACANASRYRTGKKYPLQVKGYVFEYL